MRLLVPLLFISSASATLPPYALEGVIELAREFASNTLLASPSNLTRADYLPTINGIVQHFRHLQNATGHIIDEYRGVETQYATPCFAFACATVYANGGDTTLLSNCTAALSAAITELEVGNCADGHCAFFGKPIMFAYRIMAPLVDATVSTAWLTSLGAVNPDKDYGFPSNNWGLVAAVGEFLRTNAVGPTANTTWFEKMLAYQLSGEGHDESYTFTPNGLYQDHSGSASANNPLP
jgi:hypothetical protein